MEKHKQTYAEFYYPGVIVSETNIEPIKNRNVERLQVPEGAYGFIFFDIISIDIKDEFSKKLKLKSKRLNISPFHYYGGTIYTLKEVKKNFPNEKILISNMEVNHYKKVIKCRTGNFQPFNKGSKYILEVP